MYKAYQPLNEMILRNIPNARRRRLDDGAIAAKPAKPPNTH